MTTNSNSGVEGSSGYTFQKCCVVFLLFEGYNSFQDIDYFICVEHHEDFLFAFPDNSGKLYKVDTFQAKKSRDDWKIDKEFSEILGKITLVGKELLNDKYPKTKSYQHSLHFLTNKNIILKSKKEKGKVQKSVKVQTSNSPVNYSSLNEEIRTNIESKITNGVGSEFDQLPNIRFKYIDLPQTYKGWKRILTGLSTEIFNNSINDHEAVVISLLHLIQEIELTYNNNNLVLLSNTDKMLTKSKIEETFEMFRQCNKTFDFWREYSNELSKRLKIKLPIKRDAKALLENCFDYFKDIQQVEYRKIYRFIDERVDVDENHVSETDCIVELYNIYMETYQPRLENHMVAFAVIAAYVETRGMYA